MDRFIIRGGQKPVKTSQDSPVDDVVEEINQTISAGGTATSTSVTSASISLLGSTSTSEYLNL